MKNLKCSLGQGIAESLIVFLVLISLFFAISWLGKLLDISYQQSNASRYAAFQLTRRLDHIDSQEVQDEYFLGEARHWLDRRQQRIIQASNLSIDINRQEKLTANMQVGMQHEKASVLRKEWGIEDKGIAHVSVTTKPHYTQISNEKTALGLDIGFFDRQQITMKRHTSILVDAGHSSNDSEANQRAGISARAWKDVALESYQLGRHIQRYAEGVDEGFSRAKPVFDWLRPWAGLVPKHHLERSKE